MAQPLELSQLLFDLVSIPSVNPSLKGGEQARGEMEVAEYVATQLSSFGIEVQRQEAECGRYNVIGHIDRGRDGKPGVILLTAHMDTYPPNANAEESSARIEETRLYGRGAADCKGSLAAMLLAVADSASSRRRRESYFVATVDEEYGLTGARALARLSIRPSLAITGEPTDLIPIVAQKGIVRSSIRVMGDVSHAAYPAGQNSLLAAARVLEKIGEFNSLLHKQSDHPRLSAASVTPTRILGDGEMNRTPAATTIWFDARFLPGTTAGQLLTRLDSFLGEQLHGEVSYEVARPSFVSPANDCQHDSPIAKEFFECVRSVTGKCEPDTFAYGSEAGVLAEFSETSMVFGPGSPGCCHAQGEYIEMNEVELAAKIYRQLLTDL